MRASGFVGECCDEDDGAATAALRDVFGRSERAVAVLDAEDVHRHDLAAVLRKCTLQIVLVLRGAFAHGLETAREFEQTLGESPGSGVRVLAAPWGESHFPSVVLADGAPAEGCYRLAIGRSGATGSALSFTAVVDADPDLAASVDGWFLQVWSLSTPLDGVRELEQPVFGTADPDVVSGLASRWEDFVEDVRAQHALAPKAQEAPARGAQSTDEGDSSADADADGDPAAPWALFSVQAPTLGSEQLQELTDAPVASDGPTSILAVRPASPLERDLREIYARGVLVSAHTSHKVPTFRFDANAVLGIPEQARSGRASLRSPIRLDLLPAEVNVEIRRAKTYASNVLQSHSVALAENQHWMPLGAVQHFKSVLNVEAKPKTVSGLLGVGVEDYVVRNLDNYVRELTDVIRAQQIRYEFDQHVVNRLGAAITDYLRTHEAVSVTSSYTTETLGFSGVTNDDYTRPFTLLLKVAKKSRRRLMAGDSPRRVIPAPPVAVWDIVDGDKALASHGTSAWYSAREQLFEIEKIADAGPSAKSCQALIELLRSEPVLTYA